MHMRAQFLVAQMVARSMVGKKRKTRMNERWKKNCEIRSKNERKTETQYSLAPPRHLLSLSEVK